MQKLKKQKLYVLALKNRSENYISKIGETKDQLEKRILGFGFGASGIIISLPFLTRPVSCS